MHINVCIYLEYLETEQSWFICLIKSSFVVILLFSVTNLGDINNAKLHFTAQKRFKTLPINLTIVVSSLLATARRSIQITQIWGQRTFSVKSSILRFEGHITSLHTFFFAFLFYLYTYILKLIQFLEHRHGLLLTLHCHTGLQQWLRTVFCLYSF